MDATVLFHYLICEKGFLIKFNSTTIVYFVRWLTRYVFLSFEIIQLSQS